MAMTRKRPDPERRDLSVFRVLALLSAVAVTSAEPAAFVDGTVVRVVDGDTIHVRIGARVDADLAAAPGGGARSQEGVGGVSEC